MRKTKLRIFVIAASIVLVSACKKSNDTPNPMANYNSGQGIFITHEGDYGQGNSSISFINPSNNTLINNVFTLVNNRPLGDVTQSMTIYNGIGYIVVNNSQKVEVVNIADFRSTATVTTSNGITLKSPRYFLVIDSTKAYISDWVDNNIKVINLSSLGFTKTITTGGGPEQMAMVNGSVYVANNGGLNTNSDSTVTVIDPTTDQVVTSIKVGYAPTAIKVDANNMLWVMCSNYYDYTTNGYAGPGHLVKINPSTNTVVATYAVVGNPERLAINKVGNVLYYEGAGVYKFNITDTAATQTPLAAAPGVSGFYGVGVDPNNGNIYGAYAPTFTSAGQVYEYNSSGGSLANYTVGIGPAGFVFNY